MFFLGVLCLVATAVALPVLPEAPILPALATIVLEKELYTNVPKIIEVTAEAKDDKKDDSKQGSQDEAILLPLPAAPELPPLDETILKNLKIVKDESKLSDEIIKPEAEKSEDANEKHKESEKDDVKVTIDEVKEKPLEDTKKPVIVTWKIPTAPFLSNIVSPFPFRISPISNVWPLRETTILNRPRIMYPGYVVDEI